MRGPRPAKSRAVSVPPRPYDPMKAAPHERPSSGQGPGETPTPPDAERYVRGIMRQVRLPRRR